MSGPALLDWFIDHEGIGRVSTANAAKMRFPSIYVVDNCQEFGNENTMHGRRLNKVLIMTRTRMFFCDTR